MPWGLKRYHHTGHSHFVTFSCYHRLPYLSTASARRLVEGAIEDTRVRYSMPVFGYVVMPEHVHLLVQEPGRATIASAIQAIKQSVSRRIIGGREHFWQKRYYDFNVHTSDKLTEKLRYMHRNPVKRGLVEKPEDWRWSSYRHYAFGEIGAVELESYWTAIRRQRAGITITIRRTSEPITFGGRSGSGSVEERPHPTSSLNGGAKT
jgi:putative transposase